MTVNIALSLLIVGLAPHAFAAVRAPGNYNGVVVFDRWDSCHLFGGVYDMEVSEKVKELLRPYNGQAIRVDAKEVLQPMNPGDGLITKLAVLGPAEEPDSKTGASPLPLLDGLALTAAPNFVDSGHNEFVITLRNVGIAPREIHMGALGPTLFAKKISGNCSGSITSPSDGPSYAAATRLSIPFLYSGNTSSCGSGDKQVRIRLFLEPGLVFPDSRILAAGEAVEIPIQFELTPGEYEFMAGYGGGVHSSRLLATNRLGFDVDAAGRARLVGDAVRANLIRHPAPIGPVCGRVEGAGATGVSGTRVYLWQFPIEKRHPRAVDSTVAGADGSFRFDRVRDGMYVLTAKLERPAAVLLGTSGSLHGTDAPALRLPDVSGRCSLAIRLVPQAVYSVIGRTEPAPANTPVRRVQLKMIAGAAYPFEAETEVQPDGRYEFRGLPNGEYQFFAGWTGSGFQLTNAIDDLDIPIRWPDSAASAKIESNLLDMPPSFNQAMAYLTVSQLHWAENAYAKRYGKGFTADLRQLGPPPSWSGPTNDYAGLFEPLHGSRGFDAGALTYLSAGYRVTYAPNGRDQSGKVVSYQITARPIEYGKTGTVSFWSDETGAIHQTGADRSPTRDDPKAQPQ